MKKPEQRGDDLVVTNGKGRLFIQPLLPAQRLINLAADDELYRYDGQSFPPRRNTGPAPECRVEISPTAPKATDYFLHVLTAVDATTDAVPAASVREEAGRVVLDLAGTQITFETDSVGGEIVIRNQSYRFANGRLETGAAPVER